MRTQTFNIISIFDINDMCLIWRWRQLIIFFFMLIQYKSEIWDDFEFVDDHHQHYVEYSETENMNKFDCLNGIECERWHVPLDIRIESIWSVSVYSECGALCMLVEHMYCLQYKRMHSSDNWKIGLYGGIWTKIWWIMIIKVEYHINIFCL